MRFAQFQFDPEADRLGEGPQSEVFRAVDTRLGRTVALKILRPHVEFDPQATERFEREAKHTSNLAHPNIATVYEYGQDRGTSFIAMEYLEGRTLDAVVKDHILSYEEGLQLMLQVTSALELVHHRGLIHRDLKPANIMVLPDGTVKLLDFGICRSTGESNITQDGMLVGTVLYMSPEQVLGDELDVRADIFALGSVFYHAFTGELPFPGKSFPEVCMAILEASPKPPAEIRSGFPKPLEDYLLRALSRDPEHRFAFGGAAHGALLTVAEGMRLAGVTPQSTTVRGRVLIPPLVSGVPGDETRFFAQGIRRDLSSELARSTKLEVELPDEIEVTGDTKGAFLLRGNLEVDGAHATLEYSLERMHPKGERNGETTHIWREAIEHSDSDEWGLQAKLVGSLVRSLKKKIAEYALAPPEERQGDPIAAERTARRAHEILHRGTSRHLMAAISTFRRAIEEDSSCGLAYAGLGEALVRKYLYWDGDRTFLQEARDTARRALAYDPVSAEAHTTLGFAASMSGDGQTAEREYRLAIQIDKEEWLAHRLLGALLGRQGNYQGASPLLQRAITLKPSHIGSYDHLYGVLCRLDRYQEAIEYADRGIAEARKHLAEVKDDQEARLHMALLHARMGRAEEAKAAVQEARKVAQKDAYTCFHSACTHAVLGEIEPAIALLHESQQRGYYIQSELYRNSDLEILRGRPDFQTLLS